MVMTKKIRQKWYSILFLNALFKPGGQKGKIRGGVGERSCGGRGSSKKPGSRIIGGVS